MAPKRPHFQRPRSIALAGILIALPALPLVAGAPPSANGANLQIGYLDVSPQPVYEGAPVSLLAEIGTAGNVTLHNVTVAFAIDGQTVASQLLPTVAPGCCETATVSWVPTPGNHTFTAVVDPLDEISETDEGDNARSTSFEVVSAPDLAVHIVDYRHGMIAVGPAPPYGSSFDPRMFTVLACSTGRAPTSNFSVSVHAKATSSGLATRRPLGTLAGPSLAPGACSSTELVLPALTAFGNFTVVARATPIDPFPANDHATVTDAAGIAWGGGFVVPVGAPLRVPSLSPPPLHPPLAPPPPGEPGADPRCWAYDLAADYCAYPWGVWDPVTGSTGFEPVDSLPLVRHRFDVCAVFAFQLTPFCARIDNPNGDNTGMNLAGVSYRLPRVRPSEATDRAIGFTTTGDGGGNVHLGDIRAPALGSAEWTPIVVGEPPSLDAAAAPYRAWIAANCYLNETFGTWEERCGR